MAFQRLSAKIGFILSLTVAWCSTDTVFAQIGMWPGAQGYGGLYNGYTGYRGYETGWPANAYGNFNGYNSSPVVSGMVIRRGGGVVYYSQPRFGTIVQPYAIPSQGPVPARQTYDSSTGGQTFSGSSPVVTTPIEPQASSMSPDGQGEILLFSPPTNSVDVSYLLNGVTYTMKPGTLQRFANDRTWVIEVNPGTDQSVKYTLSSGRFKFKQAEAGIGLFSTKEGPETPAPVPEPVPTEEPVPVPPAPVPMPAE